MADYAYTGTPGKLKSLLSKIQDVGVPSKATQNWLESIGFKSKSDRSMLAVLKMAGFMDNGGTPTDRWQAFRGSDGPKVLAEAIETAYSDLFTTYPDAYSRNDAELTSFFRSRSTAGKQAIDKTVGTFKALCQSADFTGSSGQPAPVPLTDAVAPEAVQAPPTMGGLGPGVTININVQLTLPETTDSSIYESLFAAMRKHLWRLESCCG